MYRKSYDDKEQGGIVGPLRVYPGGLAITRAFGNPHAKLLQFGGKPGTIISVPDIATFTLTDQDDFIAIGSKLKFIRDR